MTEIVTIASNAVLAKLHNPSREVKLEAQRLLSYEVAGADQTALFKSGRWDGRSSFFDFRAGTFPAGFVYFLMAGLTRKGYKINLVRRPAPEPLGPENPVVDAFPEDPRYDYQPEVVRRLLKHRSMIAQVATGGGKSRIARLCYARINRPTLFLTTRSILMYQMKEAFENDLGVKVSVLGDGQFGHTVIDRETGVERQAVRKMTVAMVQTLVSKLAEPDPSDPIEKQQAQAAERARTIGLLSKFEFVIGEEAHEASGNSYYEILRHCKNAHYRLALTATPFMKENEESNMRLMAAFGSVGMRVTEKLLIDRGILATPSFKIVQLKTKPPKLFKTTPWQAAYRIGIVENDERNGLIVAQAERAATHGLPVMILVQHKAHGQELLRRLETSGRRAKFIMGEDDQDGRKRALTQLKNGDIEVLIGSTILDVGVDVPAVGMVILAGGGKAEVALRQRIGRGLRAKKGMPNVCFIVDFDDPFNNYLHRHAEQRLHIIRSTEGFGERVLGAANDFDFSQFSLARRAA